MLGGIWITEIAARNRVKIKQCTFLVSVSNEYVEKYIDKISIEIEAPFVCVRVYKLNYQVNDIWLWYRCVSSNDIDDVDDGQQPHTSKSHWTITVVLLHRASYDVCNVCACVCALSVHVFRLTPKYTKINCCAGETTSTNYPNKIVTIKIIKRQANVVHICLIITVYLVNNIYQVLHDNELVNLPNLLQKRTDFVRLGDLLFF